MTCVAQNSEAGQPREASQTMENFKWILQIRRDLRKENEGMRVIQEKMAINTMVGRKKTF